MAKIVWSEIQVTGKELIYVLSALLAASGLYYKMYWSDVIRDKNTAAFQVMIVERVSNTEQQNKANSEEIRKLQDAELKRRTLEEFNTSSKGFIPFNNK